NGHLCTLRYIGPLDAWPNFTAYGVEWDDPSRGKHDGEHDGKKLFECRVEGSGSFLKSTKRFDKLSTFVEVVNDLYVNGEKLTNAVGGDLISIGSKVLEKVGFDKDINLMRLENISVSQRGVTDISYFYDLHIGKKHNAILAEALRQDKEKIQKLGLTNLKSLDLGYNLISDFSYVSHLISVFEETLESIILNGNRFEISFQIDDLRKSFENIHHLSLSATLVTNEDLQLLGHLFPKVKSLNLSMNQLQLEEIINLSHWTSLEMLDLSYNKLTATKLNQARLPSSLRKLNLSNNHIADRLLLPVSIMNNLLDLNISYNLISDWKCVEYLGCVNSELKNLRINNNPIYTRALAEQNSNTLPLKASVGIIALERLNGRAITPLDKQDAELYFISKVSNRFIRIEDFDPLNSNRWKELAAKY
ncbi:RNI-like protein, partial [Nadsonia fulvescens var. elongata DSM 6958]